ncbi:MAG: diacylglycerol kinase family protein [Archangium sp.]|nr:diacylglycerol kinase family protein [Archangium sp.]MDP3153553.1 diacylglycerol kinase family protein [Archangium sp.]MDP3574524.1 diacylglycerol kinase family protein [Archangium sp.]
MGGGARRVTLVQNPSAGAGAVAQRQLLTALEEAGHEVRNVEPDKGLGKHLAHRADVVIAAGGDGTVLGVARRLVHSKVPLAILPLGTANNLARSVGMPNDIEVLLQLLDDPRERPLDIGVATGNWGERYFCESAGVGWFAEALQVEVTEDDKEPERAVTVLRKALLASTPKRWTMTIDGEDASGEYLSVDVMNAKYFGPNLKLGKRAEPFDGVLDVVMLKAKDARRMAAYLAALEKKHDSPAPPFETRKAKHVHIVLEEHRLRIDDAVRPKQGALRSHFADLRLLAGAVRLWLPQRRAPR